MQFSLRIVFSIAIEDINIVSLALDLPAFNLTVITVTNALSNCQPAPVRATTSSDDVFAELIQVKREFVAKLSYGLLDEFKTGTIDQWPVGERWDGCFAFFPGLAAVGPVTSSSKAQILTADAVTPCVLGGGTATATGAAAVGAALKSLSLGAKAGAVIGESSTSKPRYQTHGAHSLLPDHSHYRIFSPYISLPFLPPTTYTQHTDPYNPSRSHSRRLHHRSPILLHRPRKPETQPTQPAQLIPTPDNKNQSPLVLHAQGSSSPAVTRVEQEWHPRKFRNRVLARYTRVANGE